MTSEEVAQKLKDAETFLVYIWADWCGPCKKMSPAMDGVADAFGGTPEVTKLEAGESADIMEQFALRAVPTLILFRDGQEISRKVGANTEDNIKLWIEESLE